MMTRNNLDTLLEYFPAGATESERHILPRVFVYWDQYAELLTPPPTAPRLLIGKKGTGKTAVIDYYVNLLGELKLPALIVRPMDIDVSRFPDEGALGETTRVALGALSRAVAQRLGQSLSGLLDADSKRLYDEAVASDTRDPDVIDRLSKILPRVAKPFMGDVDLSEVVPHANRASVKRLIDAIGENTRKSGKTFHLFLDDTDQVAAPGKPGHLQRIWAFLLAARELAQLVPQLRCVISIREEVWRRLLRDAAGQRDQADHFLPLARELFPTRSHIWAVALRRIEAASTELGHSRPDLRLFFDGDGASMPYTKEFRSWEDLIVVRSRERPRDAIQLMNMLILGARTRGRDRITDADVQIEIPRFSETRVNLLKQELEEECPQITQVVDALADLEFDQGSFKSSTEAVRKTMKAIPSMFGVTLLGRRLKPNDDTDALFLWNYLFELGILNARMPDAREKDQYRHIMASEESDLVSKARWNDMQVVIWEINPVYRDYLIRVQGDAAARVGATKHVPRKRHGR